MYRLYFHSLLHINVNIPMRRLFINPHSMPHLHQSKHLQYLRGHVHYKSSLNSSNMQLVLVGNFELRFMFEYKYLYAMLEHLLCHGQWSMRSMLKSFTWMFDMLKFNGLYRMFNRVYFKFPHMQMQSKLYSFEQLCHMHHSKSMYFLCFNCILPVNC